jgi:hypothetical protein
MNDLEVQLPGFDQFQIRCVIGINSTITFASCFALAKVKSHKKIIAAH